MSEKSGIEMLTDLMREVKLINKKLSVLDANVKKIMNSAKITEIATKAMNTPLKNWAAPNKSRSIEAVQAPIARSVNRKDMQFNFEVMDASKVQQAQAPVIKPDTGPTECMCHGKMIATASGKSMPLPDLAVKVFDSKDALIKQTKTNRAGVWQCQLPEGMYVANIEGKFKGQDLYPVNLNFTVSPGIKKLEVK